ncbi:MAG: DUF2993 domain-containing protein [Fimbriimonadales bacterium]|nr:DUF2993 domain-containing protein [Fimbriimonadales bacterium]
MSKTLRATELTLQATGLILPEGLRLARVNINLPQLSLPLSPLYLPEGTEIDVEILTTEDDLAYYLNETQPGGLSDFRVRAENGTLTILAVKTGFLNVEVGAEGTLSFSDGKLLFQPRRAEVAGVPAPESLVNEMTKRLNPLVDLTKWPLMTKVKEISIGRGEVRLAGTLTLTASIPRLEP